MWSTRSARDARKDRDVAAARFQFYRYGSGGVLWRFIAANNRELARSSDAEDEGDALAALADLRLGLAAASAVLYLDPMGRWRWDLQTAGGGRVQASRGYQRRTECEAALSQFLLTSPGSAIVTRVAVFPPPSFADAISIPMPRARFHGTGSSDRIDRTADSLHAEDMRRTSARSHAYDSVAQGLRRVRTEITP
jgi:uncharacterized protein YegP (UPF0339 family)